MSLTSRIRKRNSAFVPTDITSCGLWLDADDSNTITKSGNNVSGWNDKSGNSRHTSSVGLTNPQYSASTLNGKAVITFGAANDALYNSYNFNDTSLAYFLMLKTYTTQPKGANIHAGIISTDSAGIFGRSLGVFAPTADPTNYTYYEEFVSGFTNTTQTSTNNTWEIISLEFVGTTSAQFAKNGQTTAVTASGSGVNNSGLKIGSYNSSNNYSDFNANFDVAEIIVYTKTLTTGERQQIEGYLAWKWGQTGNLLPGHPYKNTPPFTPS